MAIKIFGFSRSKSPSLRVSAFFVLVLFVISSVFIYNSTFSVQSPAWFHQSSELVKNIEDINDYDATCSGYSVGRILREQKRILASVRLELAESQVKIEEIRTVQEELQRLIPQKQLELSALEGEVEAAQRQLEELRETQNIKVFLPYAPLQSSSNRPILPSTVSISSFDELFDYSLCSITTFMPTYVDTISAGKLEDEWKNIFRKSVSNLVKSPDKACVQIWITNGVPLKNETFNTVLLNIGAPITNQLSVIVQSSELRSIDYAVPLSYIPTQRKDSSPILPLSREILITLLLQDGHEYNLESLKNSAGKGTIEIVIRKCSHDHNDCSPEERRSLYGSSVFCFLLPSTNFLEDFMDSLQFGCVPIIFSSSQVLPFQDLIDWRRATHRLPIARLPESHFIVRSFENADVLEMRRMGKIYYDTYLADKDSLAKTLLGALRHKLQVPTYETRSSRRNRASPLFNTSFVAPKGAAVNVQPNYNDEYLLGPLESRVDSVPFLHNFTEFQLYSYEAWNSMFSPYFTKEFIISAAEPPAESEFYEDTKIGFRPIDPGSGVEFSKALGGNRQREQFTAVLLTYERDSVLVGALERLHQLPYLNKVIVVWNNVHREPPNIWPSLHVPVEFVRVAENSLNNRFIPWDLIETEAVLSLDDDIDLMQQDIILAFRVWRENRDRIVGFPARYHARYGDSMFYNSNHTCQMSMILTGAAFLHKNYLSTYTYQMPSTIRSHVDSIKNCEDIAMNFLVSHLTRKPPIKTTSRWTLKCPTCTESLFKTDTHFEKRHECIRLFTKIYGYNPLKFSQFRADSILFKTRLPQNHQKCFKLV